jgi:hemerythrin-like domain-containing protein
MMSDHDNGRMYLRNINCALTTNNPEALCENAYAFSQHLKQHIYKEDNILYPMAEAGISDKDKISLENEYKKIEKKLNKTELWKEHEEKYSKLESYLNNKISVVV